MGFLREYADGKKGRDVVRVEGTGAPRLQLQSAVNLAIGLCQPTSPAPCQLF